jgi:hypothetical protein
LHLVREGGRIAGFVFRGHGGVQVVQQPKQNKTDIVTTLFGTTSILRLT